MSIKTYPILVDSDLYLLTWKDSLYNNLYQALYDNGMMKDLTDEGLAKMEDGEDFLCDYAELLSYQLLVDYLILCKEELLKATTIDEYDDIIDNYKLKQIRKNFFCKYGNYRLFDSLLTIAGIQINGLIGFGLDFMILEGEDEDSSFIIP